MLKRARLVIAASVAAAVGCGLGFAPGDYGGKATTVASDSGSTTQPDGAPSGGDGSVATGSAAHLLVISGDGSDGGVPTNEIWTAPIDANGDVGAFVYNAPNPVAGPAYAATIDGTSLLLATYIGPNRVIETATFDGGIVPIGYGSAIANTDSPPDYGQFFAGSSLVSIGGVVVGSDENGNPTYDYDAGLFVSALDGGYTDAGASPSVATGFEAPRAATYKSFVYVNGVRRDSAEQASKVYVGNIDPLVGVTGFHETTPMLNPDTKNLHEPVAPMFCAGDGMLFVAGGYGENAVLYNTIDEITGELGAAWKAGPKLPDVLQQAGCFVHGKALYLVGGWSGLADGDAGAASRRILRSRVQSDGSMAGWELSAGQPLPAARSNILALIY